MQAVGDHGMLVAGGSGRFSSCQFCMLPSWAMRSMLEMLPARPPGFRRRMKVKTTCEDVNFEPVATVNSAWPAHMPKCGILASGQITKLAPPPVEVRNVGIRLQPMKLGSTSRCRTPLVKSKLDCKHYGTLRVCSVTHVRGPALTRRNCRDLPQTIAFQQRWYKAMKERVGQRKLKNFRVVNPIFGEWLYGLPQHWTDAKRHIRAPLADPPLLKSLDLFTGVGGLTLACEAQMWH